MSYYYPNQHFARGRASTLSRYRHQALAQAGGPSVFKANTVADPRRGKAPFPGYNAGHEPEGGGADARVFSFLEQGHATPRCVVDAVHSHNLYDGGRLRCSSYYSLSA
jgi:hypothetical protein